MAILSKRNRDIMVRLPIPAGTTTLGDNTHVEFRVYFTKGGINYFNYATDPKGYEVSIHAVKVVPPATEGGLGHIEYGALCTNKLAMRAHLQDATRYNAKLLAKVYDGLKARLEPALATFAATGDPKAALAVLKGDTAAQAA